MPAPSLRHRPPGAAIPPPTRAPGRPTLRAVIGAARALTKLHPEELGANAKGDRVLAPELYIRRSVRTGCMKVTIGWLLREALGFRRAGFTGGWRIG